MFLHFVCKFLYLCQVEFHFDMGFEKGIISKEQFVECIEGLRLQYLKDKEYYESICKLFGGSEFSMYDNSLLVKSTIGLLRFFFPVKDDFCEIEQYCYVLDFGRLGEEYESPEQFYDRLVSAN